MLRIFGTHVRLSSSRTRGVYRARAINKRVFKRSCRVTACSSVFQRGRDEQDVPERRVSNVFSHRTCQVSFDRGGARFELKRLFFESREPPKTHGTNETTHDSISSARGGTPYTYKRFQRHDLPVTSPSAKSADLDSYITIVVRVVYTRRRRRRT